MSPWGKKPLAFHRTNENTGTNILLFLEGAVFLLDAVTLPVYWLSFYSFTDRTICVNNPHLESMKEDILYHLSLDTATHDLPKKFGDVKVSY